MKVGDIIICINNSSQEKYLTLNKKYRLLSIDDDKYLGIKDDYNDFYFYTNTRFKIDICCERKHKLEKIYENR